MRILMRRTFGIGLLIMVIVAGMAALTVVSASGVAGVEPQASASIQSVTLWVNGEKQTVPFSITHIDVVTTNTVTFTATGRYKGPDGTYGMFSINEGTDSSVRDAYRVIPAGKTVKLKCTEGWYNSVDSTRTFTISIFGPDGVGGGYGESRTITIHWVPPI